MSSLSRSLFRALRQAILPPPKRRGLTRQAKGPRCRLGVEWLEERCVPSTVFYDDASHLTLSNTLLLDQQQVFSSPSYNTNGGPLSIRIDSGPTQGSVQLVNSFDFRYTPLPASAGTDSLTWEVLQDGVSLIGVQQVVFNLTPSPPATGQDAARITFSDYFLYAQNSDAALFMPDDGRPLVYPVVGVSALVEGASPGMPAPTGQVEFTYTQNGGPETSLGAETLAPGSVVTVYVDSALLAQPGVQVFAKYSGDSTFAAKVTGDNGKTAIDLQADPIVTDNPAIPPNAQNLTVVIVCGSGAERRRWAQTGRAHYGAGAYIITNVHSVADLGQRLSQLPAGSVSHLVIGAHGWDQGPNLGTERFNPAAVDTAGAAVKQQIRNALGNNALIDLQCCGAAATQAGLDNMQGLANRFNARVRGADRVIGAWDDPSATWITVNPQ